MICIPHHWAVAYFFVQLGSQNVSGFCLLGVTFGTVRGFALTRSTQRVEVFKECGERSGEAHVNPEARTRNMIIYGDFHSCLLLEISKYRHIDDSIRTAAITVFKTVFATTGRSQICHRLTMIMRHSPYPHSAC